MEQSHWVCYELPDHSYYYGEVGYLDDSGVVHSKDNQEAANNPANKLVKHGFGIYIYPSCGDKLAKYEVNCMIFRDHGIEIANKVKANCLSLENLYMKEGLKMERTMRVERWSGRMEIAMKGYGGKIGWKEVDFLNIMMVSPSKVPLKLTTLLRIIFWGILKWVKKSIYSSKNKGRKSQSKNKEMRR